MDTCYFGGRNPRKKAVQRRMKVKDVRVYNRHHRRCRSNGGSDCDATLSIVEEKKHKAFHCLFGTSHPVEIARILSETWIDREWVIEARRKK